MKTNIKLTELINNNGSIKTREELNAIWNITLSIMKYNSLSTAIPRAWKKIIQKNIPRANENTTSETSPYIYTNNIKKSICKLSSKAIYRILVGRKTEPATAIESWTEMFPFLGDMNWKSKYKLAFQVTKEPYFQSFQYKILNRILNCNANLYKWKIINSNLCAYCDEIDNIEHRLFTCEESNTFWKRIVACVCSSACRTAENKCVSVDLILTPRSPSLKRDILWNSEPVLRFLPQR